MYQEVLNVLNNLENQIVLEIAVFGFAIAQMLMILLTIRRERDVKELRAIVEDQRLRLVEMRAWLSGVRTSQARPAASENKSEREPTAHVIESQSRITESAPPKDDPLLLAKTREWEQDVLARIQSGVKAQQPTMPDAAAFKWFKDDPNPSHSIPAQRMVSGSA
jgi:hypothetical protein